MNSRILQIAKETGLWFVTPREDLIEDFARRLIEEYTKELKESRRETKTELGYSRIGLNNI